MEIYYVICRALSWGLLIGFFLGGFKLMAGRKEYTEKQVRASKLLLAKITGVVKYLTILTLPWAAVVCLFSDPGLRSTGAGGVCHEYVAANRVCTYSHFYNICFPGICAAHR